MSTIERIYEKFKQFRDSGQVPRRITVGSKVYKELQEVLNLDNIYVMFDTRVEIGKDEHGISISDDGCMENESLKTKCETCGMQSYKNGYCPNCDIYRGEEGNREDLCSLISDQGEALIYGFSLLED